MAGSREEQESEGLRSEPLVQPEDLFHEPASARDGLSNEEIINRGSGAEVPSGGQLSDRFDDQDSNLSETENGAGATWPDSRAATSSPHQDLDEDVVSTTGLGSLQPTSSGGESVEVLSPFPPRSTDLPPLSPRIHPGPADTSSVASSILTPQPRRAFVFNPRAQPFLNVAHLYLRRGQGLQPQVGNPMEIPGEAPILGPRADPIATERRRRDAIYHMAMVYRRLMSVDMDLVAEGLSNHFRNAFGPEYDDEVVRVIQEEPDDPPEDVVDEDEFL